MPRTAKPVTTAVKALSPYPIVTMFLGEEAAILNERPMKVIFSLHRNTIKNKL